MEDKNKKILIICFVAGLLFGTFLIISGYKKPLTQEQIEKCKIIFELKNEVYSYNKCYSLFKNNNKDVLISVFEK